MSTSSLTPLPPSDFRSAPSSDTLDLAPPKPAPKRTYGRARRLSPSPPLLGASSSSSIPSYIAPPIATTSPSKALLDRWSSANQSWRDELSKLDAPSSDKAEELPDDDGEAIKREMEKMRGQARALKALQGQHSTLPVKDNRNLDVPTNALGKTSSLTSIPTTATSPLRSSPPPLRSSSPPVDNRRLQASSSEVAEETLFPVRKSGMSGRPKKIIISDDEEDEDEDEAPLLAKDTSRSASPTDQSTTERGSSPPPNRNHDREHEDEEDNENIGDYLDDLADKQARAEKERAEEESRQPKSSALEGLDDLFDDEEDEPREKRGRRPKSILVMRLSHVNLYLYSYSDHKNAVPGLTFAKSPQTSPSQPTPPDDDIIGFTPSSGLRRPLGTTSTSRISIENPNTPTPAPGKKDKGKYKVVVPGTSEGPEPDEDDQDFSTFMDKQEIRDKEKADRDAKRKKLLKFKQNMVKQQIAKLNLEPSKPSSSDHEHEQDESEDDDLEFDNDEPTPKKEAVKQAIPKVTGAKAVLAKNVNQSTISKQKQGFLARAGKLHKKVKPQDQNQLDISETYVDFAAKTFSHAQQKQLNGGAKPANQKKGREEPLSNEDMANLIQRKHQEQIVKLRQRKEEDYGRVKVLPERVEQDFQVLLAASRNEHENENDKTGDDDEDGEDEDYNPEDEMVWSGEEQEEEEEEEGEDDDQSEPGEEGEGEDQNEDQDALPTTLEEDEDEESTPMIKRKPRASARVAFDSDEEDAQTPAQARIRSLPAKKAPLAELPAGLTATAKSTQGLGGFDFGGFGDDAGSQGFSQLFGDTQAATQAGEEDAFAALRADHVGFLPADAMLPGVQISKTQVERDNNLIAAEIEEAAMERMQEMEKPKKQYINERGLFTQTRPAYEEDTQVSDTRRQLGGLSDFSIGVTPFGKTQTQMESPNEIGSPTQTQTQTQGDKEYFTRLRRRLSDPDDAQEPLNLSPTQPARTERTVFDRMMKASSRAERQEQRKSMRKSRMVDEQAEESDEDNGWAKIGGAEENDDDDDEENDGFLEELVDDQEVDEEVRKRQDELAAEKNREIQAADDARIEAEARKITEGEYRHKKRGKDFVDGEISDEDERGGKRRKLSRKERRKRKLDREDGLDKLHGEANVFRQVYEDDLGSDEDEVDETPLESYNLNLNFVVDEPEEVSQVAVEPKRTFREKLDMLKNRGVMNRGMNYEEMAIDDADADEIALDPRAPALKKRRDTFIGEDEDQPMGDEGFSISRSIRNTTSVASASDHKQNNTRKLASYASYVQEESQVNRRVGGGAAGVSVVRPQNSSRSIGPSRSSSLNNGRPAPVPHPHRQSTGGSHGSASGSGSVLLSKGNKFA
ncbi:hypothetical protein L486_05546 [Kwoniella mangroviensis CBS 10435]|uniref:DNA replication checkpoint mediator MRC1 domain-containing protein n=1 Tax=Kwoniella mangroviensis CBS 10435 TaxID=1331196 RepID=A0A1B9IM99_9TREE|nr:hypothetical protein L486_05546 [Kwoniella mangroviensis CBS 10435]